MAQIILIHSVLGLRQAEHEIASEWRSDGHKVILPDLYRGQTAETYKDGFKLKDSVGERIVRERLADTVSSVTGDTVLAGVSLGAFLLGEHWGRENVIGAILLCGIAPWMNPRRPHFPVTAHMAQPDPFDDEAFITNWSADSGKVDLTFWRYEAVGHYFLDEALDDHEPEARRLCLGRTRSFLEQF